MVAAGMVFTSLREALATRLRLLDAAISTDTANANRLPRRDDFKNAGRTKLAASFF
jgi:hypothetical protein